MDQFSRVLFQMQPRDADAMGASVVAGDGQIALLRQGNVVFSDLVGFGKIGIKVVFSVKTRELVDGAVQRKASAHAVLHYFFVQHGQRAGLSRAYGADMRIGNGSEEVRGTAAENFRFRAQLNVNFQADDRGEFQCHQRSPPSAMRPSRRCPNDAAMSSSRASDHRGPMS